ncbi:MAG: hypothetical protein GKR90_10135 [Pseudomonadales bacterium]|nr:hypothetical protein [Pseudomonadales bacterium]
MERDSYLDGIRGAWLGELLGEAFFTALAERTDDESMRAAWRTLAELENVTGKKMAKLLEVNGEAAVTEESIEINEEILDQYTKGNHLDSMQRLKDVVAKAIVRFDQLLAIAPESDIQSVQFLVQHEQALQTFADREISGDHAHALDDAQALIASAN